MRRTSTTLSVPGLLMFLLFACDDADSGEVSSSGGGGALSAETGRAGQVPEGGASSAGGGDSGGIAGASNSQGSAGTANSGGTSGLANAGETDGPAAAPAGAYEACSGAELPSLMLTPIFEGLTLPIHAEVSANEPNTMYIAQREGELLRARLDAPDESPELVVSLDVDTGGECGLLSFALHPDFGNGSESRFYASYNPECASFGGGGTGLSVVTEYTIEGNTAVAGRDLVELEQPQGNHNGGLIKFGPDGYLYVGLGDGGNAEDEGSGHADNGNGQTPSNILGSILRLDVDNIDTPPAGNLTSGDVGGDEVDSRILHWGLRNPWRFSFDRLTGDLYIGDVGQNAWEEISLAPAGSDPINFGWPAREGFVACPSCSGKSVHEASVATDPIFAYPQRGQSSVTGGYVYRGANIPGLYGRYLFADYTSGEITAITWAPDSEDEGRYCDEAEVEADASLDGRSSRVGGDNIASFAEDADGELYVIGMGDGVLWRLDPQ